MSELVTFLLAQLDADEAVARAARGLLGIEAEWHGVYGLRGRGLTIADARHIAAHDPARVLVEVEAKRAIVALHRPRYAVVYRESDRLLADAFDSLTVPTVAHSGPVWPTSESEATLRLLASVFADRPGFDETWRP